MPLNATNSGSIIISFLMFPEKMDVNKIDKLYQSLAAKLQQIDGVTKCEDSVNKTSWLGDEVRNRKAVW